MRKIKYSDKFITMCHQVYPDWTDLHQLLAAGDVDGVGQLLSCCNDCDGLMSAWYMECNLLKFGTLKERFVRQNTQDSEREM